MTKSEAFDAFWERYPRKQKKGDAQKAWKGIKITQTLLGEMLATLAWQVKSEQWREARGKYIPLPATWLRATQWLDEPPKSVARRASASPTRLGEGMFETVEQRKARVAAELADLNRRKYGWSPK